MVQKNKQKKTSREWQFCGKKCLVDDRFQRREACEPVWFWRLMIRIKHHVVFSQMSPVQFLPIVTSDSCSWVTGMKADVVFCCCSSSTWRSDMFCILICFSIQRVSHWTHFTLLSYSMRISAVDLHSHPHDLKLYSAATWFCNYILKLNL